MAKEYNMQSHKLMYHPDRVGEWFSGKDIYPVTVEISPSRACNFRCTFCALDYLGYEPIYMDKAVMCRAIDDMAANGVKAFVVCGEGEPLLNKHTPEMINHAKEKGLDVGLTTNGVFFTREVAENCMASLTWVRVSLNAGNEETYVAIHKSKPGDFDRVIQNLQYAVALKREKNLETTIGVQLVMLPENAAEVLSLAKLLKDVGVDYFTVKPYSQHPQSDSKIDGKFSYSDFSNLGEELQNISTEDYRIIYRAHTMDKLETGRDYSRCLGMPFWTYIDTKGNVWSCIANIGRKEFLYGNIYEQSFSEVWEGDGRKRVMEYVKNMDLSQCRENCRLDEINRYLNNICHPVEHKNFI